MHAWHSLSLADIPHAFSPVFLTPIPILYFFTFTSRSQLSDYKFIWVMYFYRLTTIVAPILFENLQRRRSSDYISVWRYCSDTIRHASSNSGRKTHGHNFKSGVYKYSQGKFKTISREGAWAYLPLKWEHGSLYRTQAYFDVFITWDDRASVWGYFMLIISSTSLFVTTLKLVYVRANCISCHLY